jgi:phosphoribosylanthranilate isomerase
MIVKICGITRREDAEVAVHGGASAIGFVFYPRSPRFVTADQAAEIGRGLEVWKGGGFVEDSAEAIEEAMRTAQLDVAQIYGGEAPGGARVWRAVRVNGKDRSLAVAARVAVLESEAVLLDGAGNGLSFDWRQAKGLSARVVVAGGLDASNVAEAIRVVQPWGVDACSRLESAPGVKDHEKMKRFIAAALQA